jgi:hypothetical protein
MAGARSRSITEWQLGFDPLIGRRRFSDEDERSRFIAASFAEARLSDLDPSECRAQAHPLAELIGRELDSVWFVKDYVQLRFDEPPINLYVMPGIHLADSVKRPGDPGYADLLVGQIGAKLSGVDEWLDLGLVLDLDSGARLAVSLELAPFPEVAEFSGTAGGWIWTGGEPPWEPSPASHG